MNKHKSIIGMVVVMMLCILSIARAQSGNGTVTTQDVKKETQELINTLQQYTAPLVFEF